MRADLTTTNLTTAVAILATVTAVSATTPVIAITAVAAISVIATAVAITAISVIISRLQELSSSNSSCSGGCVAEAGLAGNRSAGQVRH